MSKYPLPVLIFLLVAACEPAEDVDVLPLPPLERLSPEARLGIPEIAGTWRFAGWEIVRGDTTALERTFPSFGALTIQVQRLDSLAGTFDLGGSPTPVIGEVRRDGWVALATMSGNAPTAYLAGQLGGDTLWLELTSVMPADEWPRGARAAFVQGTTSTPIVWLRGTVPGQPPPPAPDSLGFGADSLQSPGAPVTVSPAVPSAGVPAAPARPAATNGQQPTRTAPPVEQGTDQPRQTTPRAIGIPAPQPPPPPAPPPPPPPQEPEAEAIPEPEPEPDQGPPLLGVPIE